MLEVWARSRADARGFGRLSAHTCHWPGCTKPVAPKLWGCALHWGALPTFLQRMIWRAYTPGQEVSKTPSQRYVTVAHIVQTYCEARNARIAGKPMTLEMVIELNERVFDLLLEEGMIDP